MVACPGAWKNFEEIEEQLCLAEVHQILESFRGVELQRFKGAAALKGINLDKENAANDDPTFEAIKRRAEAKMRGISEEQLELSEIGIQIEEE